MTSPEQRRSGSIAWRAGAAVLCWIACSAAVAADLTVRLTDASGRPTADVAVFVQAGKSAARAASAKPTAIVQRNRVFEPLVTVVETGTAISFPNEDAMLHHVYSFSPAKRFEIKLYKGTPAKPVLFDVPGIVVVGCNIHDWMIAYVVVLDTPYFGRSANDGIARLANVPAGTFDLMIWYPGMREPARSRQVTLPGDAAGTVDIRLEVPFKLRMQAPPHDPMRY